MPPTTPPMMAASVLMLLTSIEGEGEGEAEVGRGGRGQILFVPGAKQYATKQAGISKQQELSPEQQAPIGMQ